METYNFNVTETSYGHIEVEAGNLDEAEEKADLAFHNGNTIWTGGDQSITLQGEKASDPAPQQLLLSARDALEKFVDVTYQCSLNRLSTKDRAAINEAKINALNVLQEIFKATGA